MPKELPPLHEIDAGIREIGGGQKIYKAFENIRGVLDMARELTIGMPKFQEDARKAKNAADKLANDLVSLENRFGEKSVALRENMEILESRCRDMESKKARAEKEHAKLSAESVELQAGIDRQIVRRKQVDGEVHALQHTHMELSKDIATLERERERYKKEVEPILSS